jgi:hypothetical protein
MSYYGNTLLHASLFYIPIASTCKTFVVCVAYMKVVFDSHADAMFSLRTVTYIFRIKGTDNVLLSIGVFLSRLICFSCFSVCSNC